MIKKVALPPNGRSFCREFLPLRDRILHGAFNRERYKQMEMVRHKDKQVNVQFTFPVSESKAFNQRLSNFGMAQLVLMLWTTAYGQEIY